MKQLIASIAIMLTSAALVAQLSSTPLYTLKPNEKVVQLNEHRLGLAPSGKAHFVALTQRGNEKWVIMDGKEFGPLGIDFSQLGTGYVFGTHFGITEEGFVKYPDGITSFENKSYGKFSTIRDVFFNENGSQLLGIEEILGDNEMVLHLSSGKTYKIDGRIPKSRKSVKIKPNGSDIVYVYYEQPSKSKKGDDSETTLQLTPDGIVELGIEINHTYSNGFEVNSYEIEEGKLWRLTIDGEKYEPVNSPPFGNRLVVYKHNKPLQLEQSTNGSAIKQVAKEMLKETVSGLFSANLRKKMQPPPNENHFYVKIGKKDFGPFIRYAFGDRVNGNYDSKNEKNEFVKKDGIVWSFYDEDEKSTMIPLAEFRKKVSQNEDDPFVYEGDDNYTCKRHKQTNIRTVSLAGKNVSIPAEYSAMSIEAVYLNAAKELCVLMGNYKTYKTGTFKWIIGNAQPVSIKIENARCYTSKDKTHWLLANDEKVIVEGREYSETGFSYLYNPVKKSFQWLTLKGRELSLKEAKLTP